MFGKIFRLIVFICAAIFIARNWAGMANNPRLQKARDHLGSAAIEFGRWGRDILRKQLAEQPAQ